MMKTRIAVYLLLALLLISYGCASKPVVYKPITLERAAGEAQAAVEEPEAAETKEKAPGYEVLKAPAFEKTVPEKKLPLREPIDPKRLTLAEGPVMINVEKMPLSDFVIYALGETLKVPFVMDEKIMNNKQPITLSMPQARPADQALEIVIGIFEKYGLYMEEKAGALYVLSKPPEPKQPLDIRVGRDTPDSPADILQVVPLRHIRPQEIEPLIKEMYKTGVQIRPYNREGIRENILLLYGQAFQVKQIIEFVETFDVPYLQDKRLFLLRLTYWHTEEFINQVSKILEGLGFTIARSPRDPGPLFIPIKHLNSILVVSPDENTSKYILEWKDKLDTAESAGAEEKAYTYVPQYSKASDLVESIRKLYGIMPAAQAPEAGKAAPAKVPAQAAVLPGLKIAADDPKNLVIIVASPAAYKNLLGLLKGLDTPPRQVLIEATIAELKLDDELKYGLEWYIKNTVGEGTHTISTIDRLGVSEIAGGLSYSFLSDTQKFQAALNAFAKEDRSNILSTPRLIVLDNREATIQIGDDIPVVTGEVSASDVTQAQPSVLRNIQYRSTGVILRVKPTINTEGLLTLDISQEVSNELPTAGVSGSPKISTRRINTAVVVGHGQTVALGGLMSETKTVVVQKVPLLGDIPLIGHLFKSTSNTTEKKELIILVTPTILTTTDQASKITGELRKELKWFQ